MHKDKDWYVKMEKEETFTRPNHREREMSTAKIGG